MSEAKYLDGQSRVWLKITVPVNDKVWMLMSSHGGYSGDDFKVNSYYTDKELQQKGLRLSLIQKGAAYEYPPSFEAGQSVWIDSSWFENHATGAVMDSTYPWEWIGGAVERAPSTGETYVVVNVPVNVPISKIKKK